VRGWPRVWWGAATFGHAAGGQGSESLAVLPTLGSLAGHPAAFDGGAPSTTLKVAGIELFCCGRVGQHDGDDELLALDTPPRPLPPPPDHPDGKLAGAILLGDLCDAQQLRTLLTDRLAVPDELLDGFGPAPAATPSISSTPGSTSARARA